MDNTDFEAARSAFLAGLQAQSAGRLADAEQHYRDSLRRLPNRPSTLTNLAAVLLQRGEPAQALPLLEQALAAEPDNLETRAQRGLALATLGRNEAALADLCAVLLQQPGHTAAWLQRADCEARLGRLDDALASVDRVLDQQPQQPSAWARRGALLKDLGRLPEAALALRRAIEGGCDPALNGFLLASIEGDSLPSQPPRAYVQQLFDGYAANFDEHLVQDLHYQAPQVLAEMMRPHVPAGGWACALDLGCGTGLCGPLLRPWVQHLVGVDLSPGMLALARARGVYDELLQAELIEHLAERARKGSRCGLLVSADVFIYVGDLGSVFAGARQVLHPGGLFALSVEEADASVDFELRRSSRYAHAAPYLLRLAAAHGMQVLQRRQAPLRLDQRQPVHGLYLLLQAGG